MDQDSSIAAVAARIRRLALAATPGQRLPSSRELVAQLRVSPVTVSRALALVVAEGAVTTQAGVGTFASRPPAPALRVERDYSWQSIALGPDQVDDSGMRLLLREAEAGAIAMASGYPHPSLVPAQQLSAALVRAARRPGAWDRPPLQGLQALRRWFAEETGPMFSAEDVLVTSGGQAAISAAMRATASLGAPILVESPTYLGALSAARAAGLRPVPVPVDEGGIRTDLLAEAFARSGARVLYCQPAYHNPTGSTLSAERRAQLMEAAGAAGAFVIEDDWGRWLTHGKPPPPPLAQVDTEGRVIHVKSLTKATAASLRIGALLARGPIAERLRAMQLVDDFFIAAPLQEAALGFVTSSAWTRHLAGLSVALRVRCQVLLLALGRHLPEAQVACRPQGGFYVWLRLPATVTEDQVAAASTRTRVLVGAGRPFFAAEPPATYIRLSFAGPAEADELGEGVRRMARALA